MTKADNPRRLRLRVALKSLTLLLVLALLWVLLGSLPFPSREAGALPQTQHRVSASARQTVERIPWQAGNVLVLYRDARVLAQFDGDDAATHRAQRAEYLVLYDRAGGMNCPLEWLPPDHRQAPQHPWHGGFREICQNQWYDAAGRSLGGGSGRDIAIPPHHWLSGDLLILGENGDNPAP